MPVRFQGDWEALGKPARNLSGNAKSVRNNLSRQGAQMYLDAVKKRIMAEHADTLPNDDNGKFIQGLKIKQIDDGVYFAGASVDDQYSPDLTMADLATILEFGTRNQAGRPVFGPARMDVMEKLAPQVEVEIGKAASNNSYSKKTS